MQKRGSFKTILFDIDHTIFNTRLYQSLCYLHIAEHAHLSQPQEFVAICNEVYKDLRKTIGTFSVSFFIDKVFEKFPLSVDRDEIERIFAKEEFIQQALYDDVEKVLQELSSREDVKLGIFSAGTISLQRVKINSFLHLLKEEHIYINEVDKLQEIPRIVEEHKSEQLFVVDDLVNVLYSLKSQDEGVTTILIERQGEIQREPIDGFKPDYTITSFPELTTILR